MILLTGATGNTGRPLAEALTRAGAPLRTASRQGSEVRFDWGDPATFGPALAGVDRVYLVAPVGVAEPAAVVAEFLRAASTPPRVVLLGSSAVAAGDPLLGALYDLVRGHCPEWTVLRPSWFMQNFTGAHPVAEGIRSGGEIVTATGAGRVPFVDAADIAAVAAVALLDPVAHNTEHLITGPRALSYAEAAAILAEVTRCPVRHRSVTPAELTERLTGAGLPAGFAAGLAALDAAIAAGAEDRVTDTVARVTGRPPRDLRSFLTSTLDPEVSR